MEDVCCQRGSLAGRALPPWDRIFLFFLRASLGGKGQPSDPGALSSSHRDQAFPLPWLVSLPWSEIQFAKIFSGLGYDSFALSLWLLLKPAPPFPVSFQISWMKLILFKLFTPMQLRAVGPVSIFFSKLSSSSEEQCLLNPQIWCVCGCARVHLCDDVYEG